MSFVPCPSCRRHVRANENACPFCSSALPEGLAPIPGARARMSRGALLAFASTLAVTGCGASTEAPAGDAGMETSSGALYGGVPVDARLDTATAVDTSVSDTSGPEDTGMAGTLYGLPPPSDGG